MYVTQEHILTYYIYMEDNILTRIPFLQFYMM